MRLLVLLLGLVLALPAGAAESIWDVRSRVVRAALALVSNQGSFAITVETVESAPEGATRLLGLKIADAAGVWFEASSATLSLDLGRVARGEIEIPLVAVEGITVHRGPAPGSEAPTLRDGLIAPRASPFDWPRSPVPVRLGVLRLRDVTLAAPVLGRAIRFDATGRAEDRDGGQAIALDLTRTDDIAGRIALSLARDFTSGSLLISIEAEEASGGIVAALAGLPEGSASRLRLRGEGPREDWRLAFEARSDGVLAAEGTAALSWAEPLAVTADFRLVPGPALSQEMHTVLAPEATLSVRLAESGGMVRLDRLALVSPALRLDGSGTWARADGAMDLRLSAEGGPELSQLADGLWFAGFRFDGALRGTPEALTADGRARLDGLASVSADADALALDLRLVREQDATRFAMTGTAEALRLLDIPPALTARAALDLEGSVAEDTLRLDRATLTAPLLSLGLTGEAAADLSRLALGYDLATTELGPVAAAFGLDFAGALTAQGRIEGTGAAPEGTVAVEIADGPFAPATLSAGFRYRVPVLDLSDLAAEVKGVRLDGTLAADLAALTATGRLALVSDDIAPLAASLGLGLAGALAADLGFMVADARQAVEGTATLTGARLDGVRAGRLSLAGRIDNLFGMPSVDLALAATAIEAGSFRIDSASAAAEGPPARLLFRLAGEGGALGRPLTFALAGMGDVLSSDARLTLATAEATFGGLALRQEGPLSLRRSGATFSLRGLDVALPGGGRIAGDVVSAPSGPSGRLAATGLDLGLLAGPFDLPLDAGTLAATADLARPGGRLEVTVKGLRAAGVPAEAGPIDLDLRATWEARRAEVVLTAAGGFGAPFRIAATVPLRPGRLPLPDPRGPLAGKIAWAGEIAPLWALVPLTRSELSGAAEIALDLSGTLADPRLAGRIGLTAGRFQHLDAGTILTDVTLASRLDETGRIALELQALDGGEGRVTGRLRWRPGPDGTRLQATLSATDAVLVRRDDATVRADAEIAVAGPLAALAIAGRIAVDRAEIRLVDAFPPEIAELTGLRFTDDPPAGAAERPGRVKLAIDISAPGAIFARGRGLDSEWSAALAIRGTAAQPRVRGTIGKVRGRFVLLGKDFDLVEGRLDFGGGPALDPDLRIRLERDDNGVKGSITVTGTALAPEIGFSSIPALPEDEVLPRLLFGTGKQALTGAQAIQLALGIRTLTSGAPGPLDVARESLGIDVLQVDPSDAGAAVTIGKNLAPGVFVGAKRELAGAGETAATVEIELFDGIRLQGEAGIERSSLGIEWSRDF